MRCFGWILLFFFALWSYLSFGMGRRLRALMDMRPVGRCQGVGKPQDKPKV